MPANPAFLPPGAAFDFTQTSLQDFQDCPRRFQYRWLMRIGWPAPPAEPLEEYEDHLRRGQRFHRLAEQALRGLPLDRLEAMAAADPDPLVGVWFASFIRLLPRFAGGGVLAEHRLSMPLDPPHSRLRLNAVLDCLHISAEQGWIIYDWKTSQRRVPRQRLEGRVQTMLYPLLVSRLIGRQTGRQALPAGAVRMVYWYTSFPDLPEAFAFEPAWLENALQRIQALVTDISRRGASDFPLTGQRGRCRFCQYRSLCDRGEPGAFSELDEDSDDDVPAINFEQIGEIAY